VRGPSRVAATIAAAAVLLSPIAISAASLKLYPVRIVLTPDRPIQTMTIHNEGGESFRGQMRLFAWRQADGKDVLEETRDILANPPLFEIRPRGDQIARFGLRAQAGSIEKSYRVLVQEIPTERPKSPGQLQTLLRISIPIFVPPTKATPARLVWRLSPSRNGQVAVDIRNGGAVHVQINRLVLKQGGKPIGQQDIAKYLLPGSSYRATLNVGKVLQPRMSVVLDAQTDQGDISATIVTESALPNASRP
jgi:fimbrial chaperone protein